MAKIVVVMFFKTLSGNEPVREWLLSLDEEEKKAIGDDIRVVEFTYPTGMPLVKKIDTKHKLWEVRTTLSSNKIARVIFTVYKDCMVLLYGFIKKDQKLALKDKNLAIDRRKKLDTGECDEK